MWWPSRPGWRCQAFTDATGRYRVPSEVLTDNGKQFTGRYTKPLPAEVLFERICRDNGILVRLIYVCFILDEMKSSAAIWQLLHPSRAGRDVATKRLWA